MENITTAGASISDSKYQITEKSILIVLSLTALTTFGNFYDLIVHPAEAPKHLWNLGTDTAILLFIFFLWFLHRKGFSRLAGILLLLLMVSVISTALSLATLSQMMIIYALPILMASFLIDPSSSFSFALVSTLGYSLAWLNGHSFTPVEFSLINISMFFGLAALSWMVSKQINQMISKLKTDEYRLKGMLNLYQMQDGSIGQITRLSLEEAVRLTQSEFGYFAFVVEGEDEWTIVAQTCATGELENALPSPLTRFKTSESEFWRELFRRRSAVITNRISQVGKSAVFLPGCPLPLHRHLIVPIVQGSRIVAAVGMANKNQNYDDDDATRLVLLARQVWSLVERRKMVDELERTNQNLSEAYENTLSGWARTLEERNKETQQHSQRVVDLSVRLARALGLEEEEVDHLRRGALLHDIGKMGIPDEILLKKGPLSPAEWEIMRRHPEIAYKILAPIGFLQPALDVPYCHHERWDGTGYPRGLKETEIPFSARIFAVVDVWEALTHDRVYHPAWPLDRAIAYIEDEAGRQFDPLVVEMFLTQVIGLPKEPPQENEPDVETAHHFAEQKYSRIE